MPEQPPVAVVGMAVLLPGAADLDTYWHNIIHGVDAIGEVPADRWDAEYYQPAGPRRADRVYCRRGGFVDAATEFDAAGFGVMPASVPGIEPDQLIALHVAHRSIGDAGGEAALPVDRTRAGVVLGRGGYLTPGLVRLDQRVRTASQLIRTLSELAPELDDARLDRIRASFTGQLGPERPESAIGLVPNLAASRVANRLDLRGPAYTVDAACASSLLAVDHAVRELTTDRCDLMLAGGVHHCHDITLWSVFSQLGALSPTERVRPFHRDADGVLIGEGTGVVVLKRLADAERDGDRIYAVVRGTGVASDGRSASLLNPDPGGQARAVRLAWAAAGLDPRAPGALGLLEAHGTATPAGDRAEIATLAEVFGPPEGPRTAVGSVKSMIGHTMPAAGIAGLIKAALAIHHGVLPPTLHCEEPSPALATTRFAPLTEAAPWEPPADGTPRRAGVNAFGFGGINAHVVLEAPAPTSARRAPTAAAPVMVTEPERVLRLAAPDADALAALLAADDSAVLAAGLDETAPAAGPARLGVVDPTARRLAVARRAVAKGAPWRGRGDVWFGPRPLLGPAGGRIAFVFPGLEAEFEPRADALAAWLGLPAPARARVGDLGRHGAAVFQLGRLLDTALRRVGVTPDAVAGHSVGEWTAMVGGGIHAAAEVDAFLADFDPDALRVPGVAFAVLGMPAGRVREELAGRQDVVLSHDNAPNQSMVCGPAPAVEELVAALRARGVIAGILPFRSGFHTPMLAPYLGPIRRATEAYTLHAPTTPVWSATTAAPYPTEPAAVRELFIRHLLEPVRFRPLIGALHDAGFRAFVQLGAGQLGSLIDDTLAGRDRVVVAAHAPARDCLAQLRRVVTALWVGGAEPCADEVADGGDAATLLRTRRRSGVRLSLGGPLLSLPPTARGQLTTPATAGDPLAAFDHPVAAELSALLTETAATAAAVLTTAGPPSPIRPPFRPTPETTAGGAEPAPPTPAPGAVGPRTPRPTTADGGHPGPVGVGPPQAGRAAVPARPVVVPSTWGSAATRPVAPPSGGPAASSPPTAGPRAARPAAAAAPAAWRIDVHDMPYLLDHCFFRQRPGWPDDGDRWPIVPATTVIAHLMAIAERAAGPGVRAVSVRDVRLLKWIEAVPAVELPVTARRSAADEIEVGLTGFAAATVGLAADYPAPPAPWRFDAAAERAPAMRAEQLYSERWMFHGPAFQGVTELTAIGDRHLRGVITAPAAPGALLDNVGQLLGYWIMASRTERTTVFPARMDRVTFHGPPPAAGTRFDCLIRIGAVTEFALTADMQLVHDGRVWAEFTGWTDRRFDTDPGIRSFDRYPGRHILSTPADGGWTLVHERWPDLATRELLMRNVLGGAERAAYVSLPPVRRRQWLLGRIAAKDALRRVLWAEGAGEIYPAEIAVRNDAAGRPVPVGVHGRDVAGLTVSIAHRAEAGVAIAGRGPCGIDIEEITERPRATVESACGPEERALLDRLSESSDHHAWFTRFWAAKEAVAKARGTGLRGRPADYRVLAAEPERLLVAVGDATHQVRVAEVRNPPALPPRRYAVAWATGDHPTGE